MTDNLLYVMIASVLIAVAVLAFELTKHWLQQLRNTMYNFYDYKRAMAYTHNNIIYQLLRENSEKTLRVPPMFLQHIMDELALEYYLSCEEHSQRMADFYVERIASRRSLNKNLIASAVWQSAKELINSNPGLEDLFTEGKISCAKLNAATLRVGA